MYMTQVIEGKQSKNARVIPLLISKEEQLRNKGAIEEPHLISKPSVNLVICKIADRQ